MTELVEERSLTPSIPTPVRRSSTSSTTKIPKALKREKDDASSKKCTKKSPKRHDKDKQKHLDSPLPQPRQEKKLKRKIDTARPLCDASLLSDGASPLIHKTKSMYPQKSPSRVSEIASWERKDHEKFFTTRTATVQSSESTESKISESVSLIVPKPQSSLAKGGAESQKSRKKTTSKVNTSRQSTGKSKSKNEAPCGKSKSTKEAQYPTNSSTLLIKPKKVFQESKESSRLATIAPELNMMKRNTPFEVDAPRQAPRTPVGVLYMTDSVSSYDDGCMTEEQRVWKGIDSVLMDADSVSTTASENVLRARPGLFTTRSRSKLSLQSSRTLHNDVDTMTVASIEDVNSKSMLRALQSSMNLSKAFSERDLRKVVEEDRRQSRRCAGDDSSLPSLASVSTCNTSTSSNERQPVPPKMPSKLDRFMQKTRFMANRRDDSSMPSLSSFRDDDFSQCSSVFSMGMPSLCSIREDEIGSFRSEADEDWRNGVATIPEDNEDLPESPVKSKYAQLRLDATVKECENNDESDQSLQLDDLLGPESPSPAKAPEIKHIVKKRRSLQGGEMIQGKLKSFMSSFAGSEVESQKQTDVLSVESAGDIHVRAANADTIHRLHSSDGCLLGSYCHENSEKSAHLANSGNMSATDFSHFASNNAKSSHSNLNIQPPNTPSRHRRAALLSRVSNSIAKVKSRVMSKGLLSPKPN